MKKHLISLITAAFATMLIGLTGCNGGSSDTSGTGSTGTTSGIDGTGGVSGTDGSTDATGATDGSGATDSSADTTVNANPASDGVGKLKVLLTDDPATYLAVYVTIDEIQVKRHDGNLTDSNETNGSADAGQSPWVTVAHPLRTYDLLTLQNGVTAELGETNISVGSYSHMRLILGEQEDNGTNILGQEHPFANYIVFVGDDFAELKVASNKLQQHFDFDVNETGVVEMTIDFDANRSIHQAGRSGKWILTPVLGISSKHRAEGADTAIESDDDGSAEEDDDAGEDDGATEEDDDGEDDGTVGEDDNETGTDDGGIGEDDNETGTDDGGIGEDDNETGTDDGGIGEDDNETGTDDGGVEPEDDNVTVDPIPDDGEDDGDTNATDGNVSL